MSAVHEAASADRKQWERVFAPAIHTASQAMATWTEGRVSLTLEEVCEVPLEEVGRLVEGSQEVSTVVALGVNGAAGGQFLVSIDDAGASLLIGMLLNRPSRPFAEWSELEYSVLMETGNILGSAYLNALTSLTGERLFPTPPQLLRDYLTSILEQAVLSQAFDSDSVLLARTGFRHRTERVEWNMLFVPSPEMLQLLQSVSHSDSTPVAPSATPSLR